MPADNATDTTALSALLSWALVAAMFLLPAALVYFIPKRAQLYATHLLTEQGPRSFAEVGLVVLMVLAIEVVSGGALARMKHPELRQWWLLVAKLAAAPAAILAAVLVPWFASRTAPAQLGLTARELRANLVLGYIGWLMVTPIVLGVFWLILQTFEREKHPVEVVLAEFPGLATWVVVLGSVLVAAPLVEELVFRGVVQPWLARLFKRAGESGGAIVSILATSALFAAIHPWPTPIPLFLLSLALGWMRQRTGSLVAPITAHVLFNLVGLLPFILRQMGAW